MSLHSCFSILPITLLHTFLCSFIIQTNLELGIIVIIDYVHCVIVVETWPVLNNWAPKLVPLYILHIPQLYQRSKLVLSSMIRILQFAFFFRTKYNVLVVRTDLQPKVLYLTHSVLRKLLHISLFCKPSNERDNNVTAYFINLVGDLKDISPRCFRQCLLQISFHV